MAARDPAGTRLRMLVIGQEEIYLHGFQGASLDTILGRAGVTKGAFFHHFESKTVFGYAVVDEILAAMIAAQWVKPLQNAADPLGTIRIEFERGVELLRARRPILGCPLNNLAQEMNPLDEGFHARTSAIFASWRATFQSALERGQASGAVDGGISAADAGHALVAQIEGILSLARNSQDPEDLLIGARGLSRYLDSLRNTR